MSSSRGGGATRNLFLTDVQYSQAGLNNSLWKALGSLRIARMSKVQAATIPQLLQGINCIVKAKTGSGKTFAYAVPIVQQIL